MKVKAKIEFKDLVETKKQNKTIMRSIGEIFEVDVKRAKYLEKLDFVEVVEESTEQKKDE